MEAFPSQIFLKCSLLNKEVEEGDDVVESEKGILSTTPSPSSSSSIRSFQGTLTYFSHILWLLPFFGVVHARQREDWVRHAFTPLLRVFSLIPSACARGEIVCFLCRHMREQNRVRRNSQLKQSTSCRVFSEQSLVYRLTILLCVLREKNEITDTHSERNFIHRREERHTSWVGE